MGRELEFLRVVGGWWFELNLGFVKFYSCLFFVSYIDAHGR